MIASRGRGRRILSAVVSLLAVLLPALAAGSGIDAAPRASEVTLLGVAADDPNGLDGGPASLFARAMLDPDAAADPSLLPDAVPAARLSSMLAIFACSGLLYVAVALSRGRAVAMLSCIGLALLPPVALEGSILRAELPCTVFGLLALLMLIGLPEALRARRRRRRIHAAASLVAIGLAVAIADALAVATMPHYGVYLLVPAGCLLLVVGGETSRFFAVLRRFRLLVLPFRAFTRRLWPWVVPPLAGILFSLWLLRSTSGPELPTRMQFGLLPESWPLLAIVVSLAVVGLVVRGVALLTDLLRGRSVTAATVLAVHGTVLLGQRFGMSATDDALPAAPALALWIGEGARVALWYGSAKLSGLPRRAADLPSRG